MFQLLTKAEYRETANHLKLPTKAYINGSFVDSVSGKTFVTNNPATGAKLADITACNSEDVDKAVAAARHAFESGIWCKMSPSQRKEILLKFAALLEKNSAELAVMESLDSGKPVSECHLTDIPETIHTIKWHAELIDKIYDHTAPTGSETTALVIREPIGVVGLV